ncbi:WecB/TagA/CpsF family glycosyltransferase [Anaeromyxobacter dehalogenans]|uniref:Glycosyl transferase, WecB/TagA/CpsF family n=1 Tax=Anaeromyxobacter dehalogenans (strain 2CP-C) TaxID=290397 RepID=Q2ILK6_ANADE|nr:WecB/TagA/CpsF family glycosyltransferase [Anaeromyxobacter dehalogenans]ABC82539.1 glycosyl transferase, WecB/TagA/CpsF family [Anaeromyxobacter dehalogenans 2CP-C]
MEPTASHALAGTPGSGNRRVRIGQLWLDALTMAEAIERIGALVRAGAGGSVFTPNVDHVVTAEDDGAFRSAYAEASLSLADGQALVWAMRLLGTPVPEKVSGSDLVWPLMQHAGAARWRVYLLGGAPGSAELAAARLERELGVVVAGVDAPRVAVEGDTGERGILERVRRADAQLVVVGLGAPKQERFIQRSLPHLGPAVALGLGASIDFLAGRVRRAPRWVSRGGLEWLFRLSQEPRRLAHRYLVKDPRFLAIVARTARQPAADREGRRPWLADATDRAPSPRAGTAP